MHAQGSREPRWQAGYDAQPSYVQPPAPTHTTAVFGILSIVFAALNGLSSAVGVVQAMLMRSAFDHHSPATADPVFDRMRAATTAMSTVSVGQGVAMLAMDAVLLTIGVLLLKKNDLGRRLAIGWAIAAFVVLVGRAVAFELVLMPAVAAVFHQVQQAASPPPGPIDAGFLSVWTRLSTYGVLGFLAIYPVSLLIAAPRLRRELAQPRRLLEA